MLRVCFCIQNTNLTHWVGKNDSGSTMKKQLDDSDIQGSGSLKAILEFETTAKDWGKMRAVV